MKLIPLLVESLKETEASLDEGESVQVSTLEALHSLLQDAPQPIVEHVPSLLPRLLELTRTAGTMVRVSIEDVFTHMQ